jgi:lincosamide nucleotidyltransferase A/C/D/E
MTATDVRSLYEQCEAAGIRIWVDGGWAVDALIGHETRPHADLDIAIEEINAGRLRAMLEANGYTDIPRDDTSPWNFVLGDAHGRRIDFHVIVFDHAGAGILGPPENGRAYPPGSLDGQGSIDGHSVRCIAPDHLVRFHTGYKPRPSDRHDVQLLCDRFGIPLPEGYR